MSSPPNDPPKSEHRDRHGYFWHIEADTPGTVPVAVWWDRKTVPQKDRKPLTLEHLLIRQEGTDGKQQADLIVLSPAQVYDLIWALNRAVERF